MSDALEPDVTKSLVLTIDLGTSGPKVALFTAMGDFIDGEFDPVAMNLAEGGQAEQDPSAWWAGICAGADRVRARVGDKWDAIESISVTSQWSGTVPVDADANPVYPAITWMDSRGAEQIRKRFGGIAAGYNPSRLRPFIKLTGGIPSLSGKDPVAHILWFEQAHPELAQRTRWYLEPKDWLNAWLTGEVCSTHDCIALHWVTDNRDPDRVSYAPELVAMSGLDRAKLPPLVSARTVVGTLLAERAAELGLDRSVKVVGGTPDVQSAAIGSGAVRDFEAHLYIGTSSWLTCHVPFKKTDILGGVASLPSPLPGRFFIANEQETAGGTLNWLRDQVLYPDDALGSDRPPSDVFARIDELARTSPEGSNGVIFAPWLNGERTPVDDHLCRGGWHNLSLRSNRADMVRAVLEGVAFNSRWLRDTVEKFAGRPFEFLNMVGGGAVSPLWCQIHADVLNVEIRQVANPIRANARGAALLAGLTLGHATVEDIAAATPIQATYTPRPEVRDLYDRQFSAFRSIYKGNRRVWKLLNAQTH